MKNLFLIAEKNCGSPKTPRVIFVPVIVMPGKELLGCRAKGVACSIDCEMER